MSVKENKIRELVKEIEQHIEEENPKKAEEKLREAIQIAEKLGDDELLKHIWDLMGAFIYRTESHVIELRHIESDGFILDIGGGGRGIIGKLNGQQVVAIDISERELRETRNEALKVIMDATNLKFLPESFDVCTAFFSLLYIPNDKHLDVFNEAYRVLKKGGRFLLWDVEIPQKYGDYKVFMVRLEVKLPIEMIETGYGVKWHTQNIGYFKELGRKAKFQILNEWSNGEIFSLELYKM